MNDHLKQDRAVTHSNESHGAASMAQQETNGEEEAPNRIDRKKNATSNATTTISNASHVST